MYGLINNVHITLTLPVLLNSFLATCTKCKYQNLGKQTVIARNVTVHLLKNKVNVIIASNTESKTPHAGMCDGGCLPVRLSTFLERFIFESKSFLRRNKSAIGEMTNIMKDFDNRLEMGEHVLSKAFDCVHHEALMYQLQLCGVRGLSHNWITSYFRDRCQSIQLSSVMSRRKHLFTESHKDLFLGRVETFTPMKLEAGRDTVLNSIGRCRHRVELDFSIGSLK
ncbi:hypothetical protein J6590_100736, partial [Homalodisca vitripennis]